ncbi:MAG: family transcriptional regulator [Paucimonas sp.]|nr:family transcriptional regulator [Paucimonas sp.]
MKEMHTKTGMTNLREIGGMIKDARLRLGISASALATASQVHRNTLSALEHGTGNVELNTLLALCEQLGLEIILAPKQLTQFVAREETAAAPTLLQKRIAARLQRT